MGQIGTLENKPYNDYGAYLKKRFGCRVYRIGIDAGFTCPNRDGTIGITGCAFCNERGSRSSYTAKDTPVESQLRTRIEHLKMQGAQKFIAYFQAFTNTHAPVDHLRSIYDNIRRFPEIVGLVIGTRPDTIDIEKLALIASYTSDYEVWIEYGLQTANDNTLKALNRGHDFRTFTEAVNITKKSGILTAAHIILGLPGETRDDMIETANKLHDTNIDGIKIHLFHILKGSPIEKDYKEGGITLLSQSAYAELVCDFLERLPKKVIVMRLTGEGDRETHLAPGWALNKLTTIHMIEDAFKRRGTDQGYCLR